VRVIFDSSLKAGVLDFAIGGKDVDEDDDGNVHEREIGTLVD
jgi:hypothetical protein